MLLLFGEYTQLTFHQQRNILNSLDRTQAMKADLQGSNICRAVNMVRALAIYKNLRQIKSRITNLSASHSHYCIQL